MSAPRLTVTFCLTKAEIRISAGILDTLEYPRYIRLSINKDKKWLLIQPSSKEDKRSIRVNYTLKTTVNKGVIVCSKLMLTVIYKDCGWEAETRYRTTAIYLKDKNAFICPLNKAIDVTKEIEEKEILDFPKEINYEGS